MNGMVPYNFEATSQTLFQLSVEQESLDIFQY